MLPHIVMDCRLQKTLGKNKRLFGFKTKADVDISDRTSSTMIEVLSL